jgi:hypothetical protein
MNVRVISSRTFAWADPQFACSTEAFLWFAEEIGLSNSLETYGDQGLVEETREI